MATAPNETESKALAKAPVKSGSQLAAFVPTSLEEAWRLSTALAQSGMLPKAYGQDPNKVMVGILAGAEVGLTPFAALQSIAVIGNNPALWGDGMLALVEASGLMEDFEETDDGNEATCRAVRKGRKTPIVRTFSMEDAKKAQLAGKAGPWSQYPQRMRQMRARSWALRDGFSDVLKGIKNAEEVRDYATMDGGMIGNHAEPITASRLLDQAREDVVDHNPETGEITETVFDDTTNEQHGEMTALETAKAQLDDAPNIMTVNSRVAVLRKELSAEDGAALQSYAMGLIAEMKGAA